MYDVIIIGGGIGGLMSAYRLINLDENLKIAIIDKGKSIAKRKCPASASGKPCTHCKVCSITSGLAGAGAFSDGKYNLGTAYGGTLGEELGEYTAMKYIVEVDSILHNHLSNKVELYSTDASLSLKCLQNNLELLDMNVRHYGTDNNLTMMSNLISELSLNGVDIITDTVVVDIIEDASKNAYTIYASVGDSFVSYMANKVIIATGRNGAEFVKKICEKYNVSISSNAVDIGVRVEMKDAIWREFSSKIYEPKILCKTKTFEDKTRMFCFNQGGIVSAENNDGVITANGHAFSDKRMKTDNCNFAILASINFTEPFNNPTEYAKSCSKMANLIGNGNVLVQRFGDLIRGRRTTESRLVRNSVKPTLSATAGDLSLALPHRILTDIIDTIYALDKVAPGTANDDTLLYGIESKYYSIKPHHDDSFMIHNNIYLIGDGSGICRGLSQSGAMGLYVADCILKDSNNR